MIASRKVLPYEQPIPSTGTAAPWDNLLEAEGLNREQTLICLLQYKNNNWLFSARLIHLAKEAVTDASAQNIDGIVFMHIHFTHTLLHLQLLFVKSCFTHATVLQCTQREQHLLQGVILTGRTTQDELQYVFLSLLSLRNSVITTVFQLLFCGLVATAIHFTVMIWQLQL